MAEGEQKEKRKYVQGRRAQEAEARTARILDTCIDLFLEKPLIEISLAEIAERAGVGLQTLIRRFETKEKLVTAVLLEVAQRIGKSRAGLIENPNDPQSVVDVVCAQYEQWHPYTIAHQRQEATMPILAQFNEIARGNHSAWIKLAFEEPLSALPADESRRVHARLVATTSFETWFWLNQRHELSFGETREVMVQMVEDALKPTEEKEET